MICDNCHHKGVCVFENNIQQKIEAINTNAEEPLQVTVTCKHFYERSTARLGNEYWNSSDSISTHRPYPPGGPNIVY